MPENPLLEKLLLAQPDKAPPGVVVMSLQLCSMKG
jgi:hypothetical protein